MMMKTNFDDISFIFFSRNCNEVAHVLANTANQMAGLTWLNEAPESIRVSLCNYLLSYLADARALLRESLKFQTQ
jgi:hypothetical protein